MASEQEQLIRRRLTAAKHFADLGENEKAIAQLKVVGKVLVEEKNYRRAIQVCKKILTLDPSNTDVASYIEHLRALEKAANPDAVTSQEVAQQSGGAISKPVVQEEVKVVGVPWVFIDIQRVEAIEALQLAPPNRDELPWDRLPAVSEEAVLRAASKREEDLEKEEMKTRTKVSSAFSDSPSIEVTGGFLQKAKGQKAAAPPAASPKKEEQKTAPAPRGMRNNTSLADSIRRKLQGG